MTNDDGPTWGECERAKARYTKRLAVLHQQRDVLKQSDRKWNIIRTLTFLIGLILLLQGYLGTSSSWVRWVGWLSVLAFLVAVTLHQRVKDALEEIRRSRSVLRRLLARLERRWDRLPVWKPADTWMESSGISADVADDLDLFGRGSLFQFVSVAATGPGLRTLATWLGSPASKEDAEARAEGVDALAPLWEQRERFYRLAKRAADGTASPDAFVRWASGPSYLSDRPWLIAWARISAVFSIVGILAALFSVWVPLFDSWGIIAGVLGTIVVVNLLITVFQLGPIHDIFAIAISRRGDVVGYIDLFETARQLPDQPHSLAKVKAKLVGEQSGVDALKQLSKTASYASIRHSGVLFVVYLVFQAFGLWDVHILAALERWQARFGRNVADWFDALGALEAYVSLAALRDEYPGWGRAQWLEADEPAQITAQQMGHPLLPDDSRVLNDVTLGPAGTVLLVTGSNMSGKSTLLRSIGLNTMLAAAGSPVCALKLQLPSVQLSTSIRVRDSLREGISYYMAELHRLRGVVQDARSLKNDAQHRVLYLLDEILQGTNSRERQIAVVRVLGHLIDTGAIGAISTHDLDLAEDPTLKSVAQTVHFRETITPDAEGNDSMTFDYIMRDGVTPTTNALRLLEIVGLGEDQGD